MLVQAAVVTGGMIERNVPEAARARSASRFGINPRLRIGSSTVQVAPSRPSTISRSTVFAMESFLIAARCVPDLPEAELSTRPRCESEFSARGLVEKPSSRSIVKSAL